LKWATDKNNTMTFASERLVEWEHKLGTGLHLTWTGNYKHAFKILDSVCAAMGQLLENYEPAFFIYLTTNAILYHGEIARHLFHFAAEMAKTKLSPNHPLALIWSGLSRADLDQMKKSIWTVLASYLDTLGHLFGKDQDGFPFLVYWLLNDAFAGQLISAEECLARMKDTIEQCEARGQRSHTLQAKQIMVGILIRTKQYTEAKAIQKEVDESNRKDSDIYKQEIEQLSLLHTFKIYREIGTVDETVKAGREALQYLKRTHGEGYSDTVWVAGWLRDYLKERGISTEGEKLEEFLDPDWDEFCERLEAQ
jgi:hypothetical protein